jgi:hypothetical protein
MPPTHERADRLIGLLADHDYVSWRYYPQRRGGGHPAKSERYLDEADHRYVRSI